ESLSRVAFRQLQISFGERELAEGGECLCLSAGVPLGLPRLDRSLVRAARALAVILRERDVAEIAESRRNWMAEGGEESDRLLERSERSGGLAPGLVQPGEPPQGEGEAVVVPDRS